MLYEVDADGVEEVSLELVFLRGGAVTENLMSRQDLPTPLLPISRIFRLYVLRKDGVTSPNALPFRF